MKSAKKGQRRSVQVTPETYAELEALINRDPDFMTMAGAVAIVVSICTGEAFDQAVARRWGRTKQASPADAPGPTKQASPADAPGPTDEAGFASGCARTDEAGFASGCARTDEAGFASGCARTDEAGFGGSPAAYGVDGEAGRVDRAGVNGVVSPPRQAWSGCGLGAGRWCESTARRCLSGDGASPPETATAGS